MMLPSDDDLREIDQRMKSILRESEWDERTIGCRLRAIREAIAVWSEILRQRQRDENKMWREAWRGVLRRSAEE